MSVSASRSDLTIQEKVKTTRTSKANPPLTAEVAVLAAMLRTGGCVGEVLRVLVDRVRHPEKPYTDDDIKALLVLTLALKHAGMWP